MGNATCILSSAGLLTLTIILGMIQGYSLQRIVKRCPTKRLARGKVLGGTDAAIGRYPYAVSLQRKTLRANGKFKPEDHYCGGALIDKDLVITAAHCVHPFTPGSVTHPIIQIGGNDLGDDADAEKLTSCRTILHEKFDASNTANGYDIALLELDTKSAKTPIKIDEAIGRKAKGQVRAIGWGKNAEKRFFVELQEVDFTVVNNTKCGKQIFPGILDSMMCAQGNSSDVCKGDSGGPLIKVGGGCGKKDLLMGLTSFGFSCSNVVQGQGKSPGIYTRLFDFAEWIKRRGRNESMVYEDVSCPKCSISEPESESGS